MQHIKEYKNGLKLVVKTLPGVLSVSTGVFVGAGSADEDEKNNGISHYIEHMMFKGTDKRSAFEIADTIDGIGAQINAFTTKEITCYYTKSTAEHTEKSFEILSDIFFNSTFDEKESKHEKKVIVEEISMVGDTPDDVCIDQLSTAFYGEHTLGKTILGSAENVKGFTRQDILDYLNKFYVPSNVVISVAGSITFKEAEKLVEKYFTNNFKTQNNDITRYKNRKPQSTALYKVKDIEQVHLAMGFDSQSFDSSVSNSIALINTVLGGGMSSRLFQEVREKKGLAYSVFSYPSAYRNSGIFTIYAAVNPKKAGMACQLISDQIKLLLKDKMTEKEFLRGKEQLKSGLIFGQESSSSIMNAYGRYMTMTGKLLDIEEKIRQINNITINDIAEALEGGMFNFENVCSSFVGKEEFKVDFLDILKK